MEWRGHCNTLTYCGNERWVGKLSAVQGAPPQRKRAGRRLKAKKKLRPFVVCPVQRRGRRSGTGPSEPGAPPPAMTFTAPVNEARGGPTLMRGCTAPYRRRPSELHEGGSRGHASRARCSHCHHRLGQQSECVGATRPMLNGSIKLQATSILQAVDSSGPARVDFHVSATAFHFPRLLSLHPTSSASQSEANYKTVIILVFFSCNSYRKKSIQVGMGELRHSAFFLFFSRT